MINKKNDLNYDNKKIIVSDDNTIQKIKLIDILTINRKFVKSLKLK